MTIPLTGTNPAGLFTRLGKINKLLGALNTDANALAALYTSVETLYIGTGLSNPEPTICAPFQASLPGAQQSIGSGSLGAVLTNMAAATVNQMVYEDNPQSTNNNLSISLNEVIRQMKAATQSVAACAITLTPAAQGTPTGNGVVVGAVKRGDGLVQQNTFAETSKIVCTADAQTGGVTAGQEAFSWKGDFAEANALAFDWPLGSGGVASMTCIDATKNNAGGNMLWNSDFETFTVANTPDNWVITSGAAGTEILKGSAGNSYTGNACLQLVGTGTNPALTQQFNLTAGTPAKLTPDVTYSVNLFLKIDVVPAAGVLSIELVDGTLTVINDDQGIANAFTINLTTATTGYVAYNGIFRLPRVLPAIMKIRIRMSTGLSAGRNCFIDHLAFAQGTRLYPGGPYLNVFSGSVPFINGDTFTITTTNDRAGSSNNATWQTAFDRFFGMRGLGLLLPTSGAPTISDTLLT